MTQPHAEPYLHPHPISQTLLVLHRNHKDRTAAAMETLDPSLFARSPGGSCNSIRAICRHMIGLRHFMLQLLDSPLADDVADPDSIDTSDAFINAAAATDRLLEQAIAEHDPEDWHRVPDKSEIDARTGPWPTDPTLVRLSRPFNDYVNHLGAIRAIRRVFDCPAERTQ